MDNRKKIKYDDNFMAYLITFFIGFVAGAIVLYKVSQHF